MTTEQNLKRTKENARGKIFNEYRFSKRNNISSFLTPNDAAQANGAASSNQFEIQKFINGTPNSKSKGFFSPQNHHS